MKPNITWKGADALFLDCDIKDNIMWFVTSFNNRIMNYDIANGKLSYYTIIEDEDNKYSYQFLKPIIDKDKLYLIPANSKIMYVYDYYSNKITDKIYLPGVDDRIYSKFAIAFIHDGYIYCFPANYNKVLKYDIDNARFEFLDKCLEELKYIGCNRFFGSGGYVLTKTSVYLPCRDMNIIAEYNFSNDLITLHKVNCDIGGIYGLRLIDNAIWIISSKNNAIYYLKNEIVEKLDSLEQFNMDTERFNLDGDIPFSKVVKCGNDLVAVNYRSNIPVFIDTKSKTAKAFTPFMNSLNDKPKYHFAAKELNDGRIIAQSRLDYSISCYDPVKHKVEEWQINEFCNINKETWGRKQQYYEKQADSLEAFIKSISESPEETNVLDKGEVGLIINANINSYFRG
jgi:hypothetical protein